MLARRSVELRGGREFMVEEVGVKFSSKDAQQSKEGMKVKATGNEVGLGLKQHEKRGTEPKVGNYFLLKELTDPDFLGPKVTGI